MKKTVKAMFSNPASALLFVTMLFLVFVAQGLLRAAYGATGADFWLNGGFGLIALVLALGCSCLSWWHANTEDEADLLPVLAPECKGQCANCGQKPLTDDVAT